MNKPIILFVLFTISFVVAHEFDSYTTTYDEKGKSFEYLDSEDEEAREYELENSDGKLDSDEEVMLSKYETLFGIESNKFNSIQFQNDYNDAAENIDDQYKVGLKNYDNYHDSYGDISIGRPKEWSNKVWRNKNSAEIFFQKDRKPTSTNLCIDKTAKLRKSQDIIPFEVDKIQQQTQKFGIRVSAQKVVPNSLQGLRFQRVKSFPKLSPIVFSSQVSGEHKNIFIDSGGIYEA